VKFRNETERLIYATAYATTFVDKHSYGVQDCHREWAREEGRDVVECWEATIAMQAIEEAEGIVTLHRKGLRERKP
jgi:hypothetical protein